MKAKLLLSSLVALNLIGISNAALDWDIDGGSHSILEGAEYGVISVYDSAVVTMTGGTVEDFEIYDSAKLTVSGDSLVTGWTHLRGTSELNIYGGDLDSITSTDESTINIYAVTNMGYIAGFHLSVIHIYGKDFDLLPSGSSYYLSGTWGNDEQFTLYLRGPETYPRVVLHEIPEPSTFFLFSLATGLYLRRKARL